MPEKTPQVDWSTAQPIQSDQVDWDSAKPIGGPRVLATPKSSTSISPREGGIVPWFEDAEDDLRHGGGKTIVGRGLGFMQGRGDKGYTGLESGTTPEVADTMGSVPLGLTHALKGVAELPSLPMRGAWDTGTGLAQAATLPAAFMGGPALDAGIEAIPSAKNAGRVFSSIRNQAELAGTKVPLKNTEIPLQRFEDLTQVGGKRSKPFTQLYQRATDPNAPLSFGEGRDFYTNVTDAAHKSPLEKLMGRGMKPTMLRQAGAVKGGLNADLTEAAGTLGRGEDYANAMKEYAQAKTIQKYTRAAALLGAGEAARRSGLLGNWIHRAALTGQ